MESRKRKRLLVSIVAIGAIALGTWFFLLRNTEPTYAGKPLSKWIEINGKPDRVLATELQLSEYQMARKAIHTIGTNALPYLLKSIAAEPGPIRYRLMMDSATLPSWLKSNVRFSEWLVNPMMESFRARLAFQILGADAAPAIPQLQKLATSAKFKATRRNAIEALVAIGPEAVAALTNLVFTSDHGVVILGHCAAGDFGTNTVAFLPTLIACVEGDDLSTARTAAAALGKQRLAPNRAIPALVAATTNVDGQLRVEAAKALGRYEGQATNAESALQRLFQDPDTAVRNAATNAIVRISRAVDHH
ncbi:hypothetical protein GC207_14370 [bacterium]|nr:hypothetical protein [bacterium]